MSAAFTETDSERDAFADFVQRRILRCALIEPSVALFLKQLPRYSMPHSTPVAGDFFGNELKRALDEQSFGIRSARIVQATSLDASAVIMVEEQQTIEVLLSTVGYKITRGTGKSHVIQLGVIYETLEDLLSAISPSYVAKKYGALVGKLEQLAG